MRCGVRKYRLSEARYIIDAETCPIYQTQNIFVESTSDIWIDWQMSQKRVQKTRLGETNYFQKYGCICISCRPAYHPSDILEQWDFMFWSDHNGRRRVTKHMDSLDVSNHYSSDERKGWIDVYIHIYICIYIYMYRCIHIYIYIYIYIYYVYMYILQMM
jgi:hypothetical protein